MHALLPSPRGWSQCRGRAGTHRQAVNPVQRVDNAGPGRFRPVAVHSHAWCLLVPMLGVPVRHAIHVSRRCVTRTLQVRIHSQRSCLQHRSSRTSASGCSHAASAGCRRPPAAALQLPVQGQGGVHATARSGERSQHVRVRRDSVLHESHRWEQDHNVSTTAKGQASVAAKHRMPHVTVESARECRSCTSICGVRCTVPLPAGARL